MIDRTTLLPRDDDGHAFARALLHQTGVTGQAPRRDDISAQIIDGLSAHVSGQDPGATVDDLIRFVQRTPASAWRAFMLTSQSALASRYGIQLAMVPDDEIDAARSLVALALGKLE